MQWYIRVIKQYAIFDGRASRLEYWMFMLINFLFGLVGLILSLVGLRIIFDLYSLAMIIPSLALQVRRLHDISRSGWWFFIGFVPFVGGIVLFIFDVLPSYPGVNVYGPIPTADA